MGNRENRDETSITFTPPDAGTELPPFIVRAYRPGDATEALRLLEECFPGRRDLDEWIWKFERTATNRLISFPVAESGGRLVGIYPGWILRLQMDEMVGLVMQPQDVCIHPNYRGGVILRAILRSNKAISRAANIQFLFGFPTAEHFKAGVRMLGYMELFRLMVWRRPLTRGLRIQERLHSNLARRISYTLGSILHEFFFSWRKPVSAKAIQVTELHRFDESVNRIWERVKSQVRFAFVKDAAYLTWRYLDRPGQMFKILGATQNGRMDGYCVFRDTLVRPDGTRIGVLVDLMATDAESARKLVETALAKMRAARCGYVIALAHPSMITAPILTNTGFYPDPHEETIIVSIKPYAANLDIQALQQPANWLLAYGDTDHVG
ncbi:hypothetical protein BROC_00559 [Candidatus Brocadiaceae bacterium]|nr:hypothetical protein BROC_00559 [Candidatus Brocadiaceae bacterium]